MSSTPSSASPDAIHNVSPDDFASSVLQLYISPHVTIRIEGEGRAKEYKLPKGLLCKQSPYFAAMFEGKFREGEEQSAVLTEMEGVVSVRSFETLLQYLFLGNVTPNSDLMPEEIDHIIEFMRLADMCGVTGMEEVMAKRLKTIIITYSAYYNQDSGWGLRRGPEDDDKQSIINISHINAASGLPSGNLLRSVLADTAIHDLFQGTKTKFWEQVCQEVPSFALDLMKATQKTMSTVHTVCREPSYFTDPIDQQTSAFGRNYNGGWGNLCACTNGG